MKLTTLSILVFSYPIVAMAQSNANGQDSPLMTALITWLPVIVLIGLWWFFFRRVGVFGKAGYRQYIRESRERIQLIEGHLADIATSLRKIAEAQSNRGT